MIDGLTELPESLLAAWSYLLLKFAKVIMKEGFDIIKFRGKAPAVDIGTVGKQLHPGIFILVGEAFQRRDQLVQNGVNDGSSSPADFLYPFLFLLVEFDGEIVPDEVVVAFPTVFTGGAPGQVNQITKLTYPTFIPIAIFVADLIHHLQQRFDPEGALEYLLGMFRESWPV